jgi:hypothetical protein
LTEVQEQNLKQSPFLLNWKTPVLLAFVERRCCFELPGKFSERLKQGWPVHGLHRCVACTSLRKANLSGMIWGKVNLESVSKAGKPPMKQSKNSILTCEVMYAMF